MNKLLLTGLSALTLSLSLTGCVRDVPPGSAVVGTGVGFVSGTAYAVDAGVVDLVGYPVTRQDIIVYNRDGVIYRNGYTYYIEEGRYVRYGHKVRHHHHHHHHHIHHVSHDAYNGHHASAKDMKAYHHHGVVYHNGHSYHIQHGKYVIVH